jgi:L-threonylcarbamoyladenylate synthase
VVNPPDPEPATIPERICIEIVAGSTLDVAVAALLAGQPIILPTDTVYGVAVDAARPGATERLFAVKGRPTDVALPVLAADEEQAFGLATDVPEAARRLAERFWPGGLTLVLPRHPDVTWDLGGTDHATIGLRVPDHEVPRALARSVGPLATTSANRHGRPTPETAAAAAAEQGEGVAVVIDGGRCAGAPSTVVACLAGEVRVLRVGRVPASTIEEVVGPSVFWR